MDFWTHMFDEWKLYEWQELADGWVFVIAMAFFTFEILRLLIKKEMGWTTTPGCSTFLRFCSVLA